MKNENIITPLHKKLNSLINEKEKLLKQIYTNKKISKHLEKNYQNMDDYEKEITEHEINVLNERIDIFEKNTKDKIKNIDKQINLISLYK